MLGVIEGSNSEKERIRSAKETSQRPVAGTEQKQNITSQVHCFNQCSLVLCLLFNKESCNRPTPAHLHLKYIIIYSAKEFSHQHKCEREKYRKQM